MGKYSRLIDGEVYQINPRKEFLNFACCDCGMVHDFHFRVIGTKTLQYEVFQRPRKTAALRKYKFGNLHRGVKSWLLTREEE